MRFIEIALGCLVICLVAVCAYATVECDGTDTEAWTCQSSWTCCENVTQAGGCTMIKSDCQGLTKPCPQLGPFRCTDEDSDDDMDDACIDNIDPLDTVVCEKTFACYWDQSLTPPRCANGDLCSTTPTNAFKIDVTDCDDPNT